MSFNFEQVVKNRITAYNFPDNIVRVNKGHFTISANLGSRYSRATSERDSGTKKVSVAIEIDLRQQALKITPDATSTNAFTGTASETGSIQVAIPVGLRRLGLPTGDYKLVEDETYVFQLVR